MVAVGYEIYGIGHLCQKRRRPRHLRTGTVVEASLASTAAVREGDLGWVWHATIHHQQGKYGSKGPSILLYRRE